MTATEFFSASPAILAALSIIPGLVIGSFLNVVIYRLPLMMEREAASLGDALGKESNSGRGTAEQRQQGSPAAFAVFNLATPPSHCPRCKQRLSLRENIPLVSYLLQGGRCRHCQAPIGMRYPLIELAAAVLTALVMARYGLSPLSLAALIFVWGLLALAAIDCEWLLAPDAITLPLLWLGLLANSFGLLTSLESAVWGAMAGYLAMWAVYWLFKLATGKDGLGRGDFKLLAALGAWLGWQALPLIIMLASFGGALVGAALLLRHGRDFDTRLPFAPYLAGAGFISLLWQDDLNLLFWRLFA